MAYELPTLAVKISQILLYLVELSSGRFWFFFSIAVVLNKVFLPCLTLFSTIFALTGDSTTFPFF